MTGVESVKASELVLCDGKLTDKEEKLLTILNSMWECLPVEVEYEKFNQIFSVKDVNELRSLEKVYPEVGIAKYGTSQEGFSIVSLLATITDVLINKRLAVVTETINNKKVIKRFELVLIKDK